MRRAAAAAVAIALLSAAPAWADPATVDGPVPPVEAVTPGVGFTGYNADGALVGSCTLGFLATDTTGRRYAFTAGHCSSTGNAVTQYQTPNNYRRIGLFAHTIDDSSADIAAIALADTAPPQDARVLERRPVTGVIDAVTDHDVLCFYGMRTGGHPHCGQVTSPAAATDRDYLVQFAVGAVRGDSGSPVYRIEANGDATAVGILDSTTGDTSTATLIKPYLDEWGLSLTCQSTPTTTEKCHA